MLRLTNLPNELAYEAVAKIADATDGADGASFKSRTGQTIRVKGRVAKLVFTGRSDAFNLLFDPPDSSIMAWVERSVAGAIKPETIGQLEGAAVVATGKVIGYPFEIARRADWQGRLQLQVNRPDDSKVLLPGPDAWSTPPPATQPSARQ